MLIYSYTRIPQSTIYRSNSNSNEEYHFTMFFVIISRDKKRLSNFRYDKMRAILSGLELGRV